MKKITFLAIVLLMAIIPALRAATPAKKYIDDYTRLTASGGESAKAYDLLLSAHREYFPQLDSTDPQAAGTARDVETWLFPLMADGAFFHSGRNDQARAETFAEAHLDISLHNAMATCGLTRPPHYPTLAYFAASNSYNSRNYDKAVRYLDAYIKSGDTKNVREALAYMAKAYVKLGLPDYARQTLDTGLTLYPDDLQMLTTAINLLAESEADDTALQRYVSAALLQRPTDEGLLNIQGQLYERTGNFDGAIDFYSRLRRIKPKSLEVARHLAVNYYNAGVREYTYGRGKLSSRATQYFRSSAQLLSDIVVSDPLSIHYVYALANTYSLLGDKNNLAAINQKIAALGRTPVSGKITPEMMAVNAPQTSPASPLQGLPPVPGAGAAVASTPAPAAIPARPAAEAAPLPSATPQPAAVSDVDRDIPVTGRDSRNTFAVIIANSDYQKVAHVDNAGNDGKVFAEYCRKVLGVPDSHIRTHYNVTYGELLDAIEDIKSIARAKRGDLDIIFYYAGHGVPNEATKSANLLPVDADGKQMRVCYPLSELYAELAALNARRTLVFLDACFSGASRGGSDMLLAARSVAIDVDPDEIEGKLIVFSASSGNQTAFGYKSQNHGMFTYFLLKKLKETRGAIDLGSLSDYLTENVALESQLTNRKQQIPTVVPGNAYTADSWQRLPLLP